MATASFDEKVVIRDKKTIKKLVEALSSGKPCAYVPSSPEKIPSIEEAQEAAKRWKL